MGLLRRRARNEAPALSEVLMGAELPTFPRVATAALERLGQPDVDLTEIGDLLVADPGVSARLLRIVNSAAVGARRQIESVHQAVTLLGVSQLESLLISAGVQEALPSSPGAGHDPREFWQTSARRAAIAAAFAGRIVPASKSETFTAALLQDMALPLLAAHRPDYGELVQAWREGAGDLTTIESDSFGSDHATIAGQMCEAWEFPDSLRAAIESHHDDPADGEGIPFVQIVSVLRDSTSDEDREELCQLATQAFDLHADDTAELIAKAETQAADLAALLT